MNEWFIKAERSVKLIRIYKKKARRYIAVVSFCLCLLLSAGMAIVEYQCLKKSKYEVESLRLQLEAYQKEVYVAMEKLPKGTVLTEDKVCLEIRYSDSLPEDFITENEFGMVVLQDIAEGSCITKNMVCSAESNIRQIYISEAELPVHVAEGSRIDVRIRYKNAEDYIVLADKTVIQRSSESGMVLEVTEEELLLLSSALYDRKMFENTKLYVVTYPEYRQVESGTVNYIASKEILAILGREKAEGESRVALEMRLMQK